MLITRLLLKDRSWFLLLGLILVVLVHRQLSGCSTIPTQLAGMRPRISTRSSPTRARSAILVCEDFACKSFMMTEGARPLFAYLPFRFISFLGSVRLCCGWCHWAFICRAWCFST